ncbi:hypothetical protein B0H10DRAFT_2059876 [Mycena sp. CBHHK59/15]|nr:hypothetical protein B0H10DRAFT_2059876 [Mycena sp. CBHHK59/15]
MYKKMWSSPLASLLFSQMLFNAVFIALVPAALAANHAVSVGASNGLTFTPTSVAAAIGDTLTFIVLNHHDQLLWRRLSPPDGGVGVNGFDSGYLSDLDGSMPQFVLTVVDTAPHFVACKQAAGAHCRAGMTFALNPTTTMTYVQFNANAEAS